MALSYNAVQKAYDVFNQIKNRGLIPDLIISSFPEDLSEWSSNERCSPKLHVVYGYDRKFDNGWENIFFFVKSPSRELIDFFDTVKQSVPNSSMCSVYSNNEAMWILGWF